MDSLRKSLNYMYKLANIFIRFLNSCRMSLELTIHLIAGYVKMVAAHFETAPSMKAEKAERASGDDSPPDFFLVLPFSSLCFS